jgi:hypothetical protein
MSEATEALDVMAICNRIGNKDEEEQARIILKVVQQLALKLELEASTKKGLNNE